EPSCGPTRRVCSWFSAIAERSLPRVCVRSSYAHDERRAAEARRTADFGVTALVARASPSTPPGQAVPRAARAVASGVPLPSGLGSRPGRVGPGIGLPERLREQTGVRGTPTVIVAAAAPIVLEGRYRLLLAALIPMQRSRRGR